jgi:NAD(P)-dependent dehydrogenase (short-subunit alcohol dehydrogenase family)
MPTALVTGANRGIGRETARQLAERGYTVVLSARDEEKARAAAAELSAGGTDVRALALDVSDPRSIEAAAGRVAEDFGALDVLVNNAGIGGGRPGTGREVSADGIELRFAVNYLAGYHLTRRLLPRLAPAGRIVNVASAGQQAIDFEDPMMERDWDGFSAYQRSKLAQIMFTVDLAAEQSVVVNALHPATFMDTTMVTESGVSPISSVAEGADATMRLITAPDVPTGRYFNGLREARANAQAYDADARARLRTLSDNLITTALR